MILEMEPVPETDLPEVQGWRVLVQLAEPKEESAGGIILPDQTKEAQQYLCSLGRVIGVGPLCWKHPKFQNCDPWCKVGDWIALSHSAGQALEVRGKRLRLIYDENVMAVVPTPEALKIYVE